jgi:hypothetical protein
MTESKFAEIAVPIFLFVYFLAVFHTAKAWSLFRREPTNDELKK